MVARPPAGNRKSSNDRRLTTEEEHRLVERFREDAPGAMQDLVERYEEGLYNFGLRMCGQKEDAEDIMQETFLSAFSNLENFREEARLKNWLFKIAANACYRKRRKKSREPDYELSLDSLLPGGDGEPESYQIPDISSDPSEELLRAEFKEVVREALNSLPPKYRMTFSLRDMEGFSTEETAEIMGVSPQAVKTRLHRARLFLRKAISEHYRKDQAGA
ncbi:MAG: RNA polymerase sigma factor [Desulfobacteraceae bacterium]